MKHAIFPLLLLAITTPVWAQPEARPEILILGTFHMANPGHDIHNLRVDDVRSPERQREITQLNEVLERFRPTKIVIEAEVGSKRVAQEYQGYLAGTYTLSANETNQIGYRLAKKLGHTAVYPVDVDGDFPWTRLVNYAKANNRAAELEAISAQWGASTKELGERLASHSILDALEWMNTDTSVGKNLGSYFATVRFGEPYEYAGADLLAAFYQRNIRIYSNIVRLIDSPNERILVVYGAGHLGWLRQYVASDPAVRLRTLADYMSPR